MDYQDAVSYLKSYINYEESSFYSYPRVFRLNRVKALFDFLKVPYNKLNYIHITGTKGKGSVCSLVTSILTRAGYKVGLFTSPHLETIRERIRIFSSKDIKKNLPGTEGLIAENDFAVLVEKTKPGLEEFKKLKEFGRLTFFEVYTLLAIIYFLEKKVDFAVLEVGMGGRLDATNIITPLVCGITSISMEHTNILGKNLEAISAEKAGIIKEKSIVVNSVQDEKVQCVIEKTVKQKDAVLYQSGRDILYKSISSGQSNEIFRLKTKTAEYDYLKMPLSGFHQLKNAAVAVGIIEALADYGLTVSRCFIEEGISKVSWPGRMDLICTEPYVLLDGAQNAESAFVLKEALASYKFDNLFLILGICRDKDIKGVCRHLIPLAKEVFVTKIKNPRSAEFDDILFNIDPEIRKSRNISFNNCFYEPYSAFQAAFKKAGKKDMILVAGSLFLVGEIRAKLEHIQREKQKCKNLTLKTQ